MAKERKEDQPIPDETARQMFDWHYGPLKLPIKAANKRAGVSYRQGNSQLWGDPDRMSELWEKVESAGHASMQICAIAYPILIRRLMKEAEAEDGDGEGTIKTIDLNKICETHKKLAQSFLEYERPPQTGGGDSGMKADEATELQKFLTGVLSKATDAEVTARTPLDFDEDIMDD